MGSTVFLAAQARRAYWANPWNPGGRAGRPVAGAWEEEGEEEVVVREGRLLAGSPSELPEAPDAAERERPRFLV